MCFVICHANNQPQSCWKRNGRLIGKELETNTRDVSQGYITLIKSPSMPGVIKVESTIPEGLCHIGDAILAHDVEGEVAGTGHDAGIVADAAFVFVAGDIADIVVAVVDAPMASDGGGPIVCGEAGRGGDVICDIAASQRWLHRPVAVE
jgi:hypothetical protein